MINCSRFLNVCTQPARSDSNICGFVFRLLCVVATIIRMLYFLCRNYSRNNSSSYYAVQLIREMKKRYWLTYISNDSASESLMIQKKYNLDRALDQATMLVLFSPLLLRFSAHCRSYCYCAIRRKDFFFRFSIVYVCDTWWMRSRCLTRSSAPGNQVGTRDSPLSSAVI